MGTYILTISLASTTQICYRWAKILGCLMKQFAKTHGICDASRGYLSSYAYILLVIFYLQQCGQLVLPVLQEIYTENGG